MADTKTLVKMLKWVSEPPYRVARVLGGHYAVEVHEAGATLSGNFTRVLHFATGADAEAAAQADYDSRIKFVLADALASHEARIAELEGALRALRECVLKAKGNFAVDDRKALQALMLANAALHTEGE